MSGFEKRRKPGALCGRNLLLIATLLVVSLLAIPMQGCRKDQPVWPNDGKPRVLTTFAPLYCFAKNVAGDDAHVECLLTTQGPHGFSDPSNRDQKRVRGANVFFALGLGLDEFAGKISNNAVNSKALLEIGEKIPPEKLLRMDASEHMHGEGDHHHHHGEFDPHVWLSPEHAILMVEAMEDKLCQADSKNKEKYHARAQAYAEELKKLHAYGNEKLAGKKNRKIISTHDALRYFGQAFGVEIVGCIRPTPEDEAGAAKISQLVKICKEQDVRVIAHEPQYSTASAETVRKEAANRGLKILLVEIDPLETADTAPGSANPDPGYYLKRMRENIDNLAKALP
ncbi:MAG: zinc ABC transporter substrate-binding protein [Planctomycetes bacterium]|nr:zinc ABC transporter substrate-binding protein [Planctomycetota bacterium]